MSSLSLKIQLARLRPLRIMATAALVLTSGFLLKAPAQQPAGRAIVFPVTIQWGKQKAVSVYRLQIAADEKFQDVFLDKRTVGERYVASDLTPGYYFWRVAPAEPQLGSFSKPTKFFISGGVVMNVKVPNRITRTRSVPAILITSSPRVR